MTELFGLALFCGSIAIIGAAAQKRSWWLILLAFSPWIVLASVRIACQ